MIRAVPLPPIRHRADLAPPDWSRMVRLPPLPEAPADHALVVSWTTALAPRSIATPVIVSVEGAPTLMDVVCVEPDGATGCRVFLENPKLLPEPCAEPAQRKALGRETPERLAYKRQVVARLRGQGRTYAEIAQMLGCSRSRVGQIAAKAVKDRAMQDLAPFLGTFDIPTAMAMMATVERLVGLIEERSAG